MADLHIMGDFEGPNERRVSEHLASELPEGWHVIPNRKLPTRLRDDVDIFVLGINKLFVIEEKSWGPKILLGDQRWNVVKDNGRFDERWNPLNSCSTKARKTASWLRDEIYEYRRVGGHQVLPLVLLSHPKLTLHPKPGYKTPDEVFTLAESVFFLQELDKKNVDSEFSVIREKILGLLLDLEVPDDEIKDIDGYVVSSSEKLENGVIVLQAEDRETSELVTLKCYENHIWGDSDKPNSQVKRETLTLTRLRNLNRTWNYHRPFQFEKKNWTVVPLVKPIGAKSLTERIDSIEEGTQDYWETNLFQFALESFTCLSEIHAENVAHKALTPDRIWLGKSQRVYLSDFYSSHIDGLESVVLREDDAASLPYRAPEASESLAFATDKSDVFSLSLILATLRTGANGKFDPTAGIREKLEQRRTAFDDLLLEGLTADPAARPNASAFQQRLLDIATASISQDATSPGKAIEPEADVAWMPGELLDGRYHLEELLGEGAVGVTWKITDQVDGRVKVLKKLKNKALFIHLSEEFRNASRLNHPRCASIIDFPNGEYLIAEFVEGVTLQQKAMEPDFTIAKAREICAQVLDTLSYIHEETNYVHGDLSPRNILIGPDGVPTLIDFGLLTKIGGKTAGGSYATMSPEVAGQLPVTPQSDLFSFAASMIISLLGRPPYRGEMHSLVGRTYETVPLTLLEREQWGDDGVALLEVLFAASAGDPTERPHSARALREFVKASKPIDLEKLPTEGASVVINPNVGEIRKLFVRSKDGAANALGLASEFSTKTYSPSLLDRELLPAIVAGEKNLVILTGNPGDGKTSFLQAVFNHLVSAGANVQSNDSYGWEVAYQGRLFNAVFDASEATDEKTSNEIVNSSLSRISGGSYTSLIAVNDGRLRQFFDDFEDEYPEFAKQVDLFFEGSPSSNPAIAVIDLKTRALVETEGQGLASDIIDQLVADELWEPCLDCVSKLGCPIFGNRELLSGEAKQGITELLLTSQLKRKKRSTLRQVRSTLGWVITGDLDCEDVHKSTTDLVDDGSYSLPELAFSDLIDDPLIEEWRLSDPAQTVSVEVEQHVRATPPTESEIFSGHDRYSRAMRNLFFRVPAILKQMPNADRPSLYKNLKLYQETLSNPSDERFKAKFLRGMSSLLGATGYTGDDLVIASSKAGSSWAVVKSFSSENFKFCVNDQYSEYIEYSPDQLILEHNSGYRLLINLDSAELVLRAAEGELFGDGLAESIRFELDAFAQALLRENTRSLHIVEPNGTSSLVEISEKNIVLKESGRTLDV